MENRASNTPGLLPKSFLQRETSFVGRQQLYVFMYNTVAVLGGLLFNLIGAGGPQRGFNLVLNSIYLVVVVLLLAGYLFRVLKLSFSLIGIIMAMQLATSLEMLYCAYNPDEYHLMLIVGNMVLLAVNILLSLLAYLEYIPFVLGALSMGTYIACAEITKNDSLGNFLAIFFIVFLVICLLGNRMVHNVRSLDKENRTIKREEDELFNLIGQNKEQIMAYIEIAKEKRGSGKTKDLLDMVSDKARRNIVNNIKEYLLARETDELEMETVFPELSASEREVCRLVLQGKTLVEVCTILDKKESNITCTRAHIRKKLNLKPEDNLRKALQERVKGASRNSTRR